MEPVGSRAATVMAPMNPRSVRGLIVFLLVVLAAVLVTRWVWAGGSEADAKALEERLRGLKGVVSVEGRYTPGEDIPFSGSTTFVVAMAPDSAPDEVIAVVTAAYDDFSGTLRRQPADLGVDVEGVHIKVHTEGPDVGEEDLVEVVRFALGVRAAGERVEADINARDHEDLDDLVSEIRLLLPEGSTVEDVLPRLEAVRASEDLPADVDFYAVAADGAGLGGSRGLPTEDDIQVWRELSAVGLPGANAGTVGVEYGPYQIYSGMQEYGLANVTVRSAGERVTKRQVSAIKEAHLRVLRRHHHKYVYNLTVNGEDRVWLQRRGQPG